MGAFGGLRRSSGGFAVSGASLNLLRYPRRWHPSDSRWLVWAVSGWLVGLLLGVAWGEWSQREQAAWQAQRSALQARLKSQARTEAERVALAQQERWVQQAQARRKEWQAQRAQLQGLHGVLGQAMDEHGLRVQRWQGHGQRIQLQGWLPHAEALPALQLRLAQAGPHAWTLHSLTASAGSGLQMVLEAPWTVLSEPTQQGQRP